MKYDLSPLRKFREDLLIEEQFVPYSSSIR